MKNFYLGCVRTQFQKLSTTDKSPRRVRCGAVSAVVPIQRRILSLEQRLMAPLPCSKPSLKLRLEMNEGPGREIGTSLELINHQLSREYL